MAPKAKNRPDHWYWELPVKDRPHLDPKRSTALIKQIEVYSRQRFQFGFKFRLVESYYGIPEGAICTVVVEWPAVLVEWENVPWWRSHEKQGTNMSFELDSRLEFIRCSEQER